MGELIAVPVGREGQVPPAAGQLHPSAPPWAVVIEHAWEPHKFEEEAGLNGPIAGLLSPLELAGGWGRPWRSRI